MEIVNVLQTDLELLKTENQMLKNQIAGIEKTQRRQGVEKSHNTGSNTGWEFFTSKSRPSTHNTNKFPSSVEYPLKLDIRFRNT